MTKAQHTPGPWEVVRYSNAQQRAFEVVDQHSQTVACVFTDQDESNARLIAAAPDLLAALKALSSLEVRGHALIDRLQFSDEGRALASQITKAIAKATGE